ncbi:spermatogenesis-associated protein 6 [Odontomachus brunneus]|uniref:spermatogenesis-associated protein 6 n=1 Tax=Odontomachus brunneus TaxID=486640 RepID=UPI0013F2087F|nr:spermatogenesis-associated protein 6 [Odontomachus brunneus]XP_032679632.1 spermatogenesis-associated protein 6 [Odontomachus brunneus]
MAGRAFCVKIQVDVHAVTCPGVWLCPNGKVALLINTLNSCVESQRISPIFPLLFHDRFTFSKVFTRIASLTDLQRTLEQEFLHAELIQWVTMTGRGITLATFETNLADLLYPAPCFKGLLAGVDIDLLMETTKCFPGIIAPKIEVSTKTVVEEVLSPSDTSMSKCYVVNPKMINSKQTTTCDQRKRPVKGIIRQRRVCHTKSKLRSQSCRPYRQRSSSVDDSHRCRCITSHRTGSQQDHQCYHILRKDGAYMPESYSQKPAVCDNSHVMDNCPVCLKYNCYFSKCYDDSVAVKGLYIDCPKQKYSDTAHYRNSRFDNRACCCVCGSNSASDTQEEPAMSILHKMKNLQKTKGKLYTVETDDVADYDSSCEFTRDRIHSSQTFYKNLEKFYKRMYKQAKIRAQEVED